MGLQIKGSLVDKLAFEHTDEAYVLSMMHPIYSHDALDYHIRYQFYRKA